MVKKKEVALFVLVCTESIVSEKTECEYIMSILFRDSIYSKIITSRRLARHARKWYRDTMYIHLASVSLCVMSCRAERPILYKITTTQLYLLMCSHMSIPFFALFLRKQDGWLSFVVRLLDVSEASERAIEKYSIDRSSRVQYILVET